MLTLSEVEFGFKEMGSDPHDRRIAFATIRSEGCIIIRR
jgi:hypothetical protein